MDKNLKSKILDTALDIVDDLGLERLTQPRLAKAAGIRQSHLTYYFPRKADLFIAILEASHQRAENAAKKRNVLSMLQSIMFDRKRMRFFLGILLEVSEDPELRSIMAAHSRKLHEEVAGHFNLTADDPRIQNFISLLRGYGLAILMHSENHSARLPSVKKLAEECGLRV